MFHYKNKKISKKVKMHLKQQKIVIKMFINQKTLRKLKNKKLKKLNKLKMRVKKISNKKQSQVSFLQTMQHFLNQNNLNKNNFMRIQNCNLSLINNKFNRQ